MTIEYGSSVLPERFWKKVYPEPNTGCWLWGGSTSRGGYGKYQHEGSTIGTHRLIATICYGLEPDLFAMHSCDNPPCVNPDHLSWGTPKANQADKARKRRGNNQYRGIEDCKWGHPFDVANTRWLFKKNRWERRCKACQARYMKDYFAKKKASH